MPYSRSSTNSMQTASSIGCRPRASLRQPRTCCGARSSRICARLSPRAVAASRFATRRRCTSPPWREGHEQSAVLVVCREEVGGHVLHLPAVRPEVEPLAHSTDAPLERQCGRVAIGCEAGETQALDDVTAEQVGLGVAGQLEHSTSGGDDATLLVTDDEARVRRGVVVVHQLEQEPEAAALACDRDVVDLLQPVVVDGSLLAVGTDEERHTTNGTEQALH